MEMDVDTLKAFKKGEKISTGVVFPFEDDEIEWEAISVGDGSRMGAQDDDPYPARPKNHTFRFVQFTLRFLGVEIGEIMAEEQDDNTIRWSSIK